MAMVVDVLTIFPEMLRGFFAEGIVRMARERGAATCAATDIREFTEDVHRKVDDTPFGGGPGMVMMAEPVIRAYESVTGGGEIDSPGARAILLTPQGRRFDQAWARELSRERHLVLICGRYEGMDERAREHLQAEELSIGDYVLAGGEVAAMAVIEAVVRLLPGTLGNAESARCESFEADLLDHPQYTRPRVVRGLEVPEVLVSGDHARVEAWREEEAARRTADRRPDLAEEI